MSLDLKFNPRATAITFRPEWRSMSKTVFTQYDPFETWYTCQSDVWLDDVKTCYPRPIRCVIVVHPYPLAQEDTTFVDRFCLSLVCKNMHRRFTFLSRLAQRQARDVEQERQKNEISNSAAFITETNHVMWSLLTNTIPHGRTIMYMVTPTTEASMMAVGQQLTDDSATRLKNDFATKVPNVAFSYIPFQDDDMKRLVEVCSLEMFLLQNANANDEVIIIADTRQIVRT